METVIAAADWLILLLVLSRLKLLDPEPLSQSGSVDQAEVDRVPVAMEAGGGTGLQKIIVGDKEHQNSSLDHNNRDIKEEEEEVDIIEFICSPVKSEDDNENLQSLQLHHSQTEEIRDCLGGENCGGAEADPDPHLQPGNKTSDSSETDLVEWQQDPEAPSESGSVDRAEMDRHRGSADVDLKAEMEPRREGLQKMVVGDKEQQEENSSLNQNNPGIKQEEEEEAPGIKQEVEVDIIEFIFSPVKSEDEAETLQSLQLHHIQTEELRDSVLGQDCGGHEGDPDPDLDHKTLDSLGTSNSSATSDSSDTDASDSDEADRNDGKKFSCPECGKRFGIRSHFTRHMRTHTGERPYSCPVCHKTFSENGHVKNHMRIHTGEKPYSCSMCSKSFSEKGNLNKHMMTHMGEKPYSCSVCSKSFSQKGNLNTHMRIHTREKPDSFSHQELTYSMKKHQPACGAAEADPDPHSQPDNKTSDSTESSDLSDSHEVNSDDGKRFCCSQCGKRFGGKENFIRHTRIHTGEKPYCCSFCNKSFSLNGTLKRHMRIHTGEKPYSCSVCSKLFNRKESMKTHMIIHTREKLNSCRFDHRELVCGGDEADPDPHLQPDSKTLDSSETSYSLQVDFSDDDDKASQIGVFNA
ncbi:uncharacterized protein KZ484_007506 [Pholidichthys leucotaenia]